VIGGGIAGLVAAREFAVAGARTCLVETGSGLGGCIARHTVAGLALDCGAESFATRNPSVSRLVESLGLADRVVTPQPVGPWVYTRRGPVPLPSAGLLGIPVSAWSREVRRAVGLAGTLRAGLDDVLPRRIGTRDWRGRPASLGRLVRARMGSRVLRTLVGPVVSGVYSADPDQVDIDAVAPGLRDALTREGTLGKAVGSLRTQAPPGAVAASLVGGMAELVLALAADLRARGVQIRTNTTVGALRREGGHWLIDAGDTTLRAADVMVCTPGEVAAGLLSAEVPSLAELVPPGAPGAPGAAEVVLATFVLRAPELDSAPRGTGVLVSREATDVAAKGMTHATAKWDWLREAAGPGRHVIRLSYGRAGEQTRLPDSDDEFATLALRDASRLLGVDLDAEQVEGFARTEWPGSLPYPAPGHRKLALAARDELRQRPGIDVAGAWIAGTGLAAVVADSGRAVRLMLTRTQA